MKKIIKISLTMIVFSFLSIIVGTTNVKAAEPIIFQNLNSVEIKELDLGPVAYDTSKWQSFKIKNTTSDEITITNVRIDTPNFEIEMMPGSTIKPNATEYIQINNTRGLDVSASPVTGNLIVTVNNTTEVTLPLKVTIEKGTHVNPSYLSEVAIGTKLTSISLTDGWVWVNPDAVILEGKNNYQISYTDTTGNYKDEIREVEINGLKAYNVILPTNPNTWTSPQSNYTILEGYSSNLTINASSGYFLTSITINGVEQITNKTKKFDYKITNISNNIVIEAKTERIVYNHMKDPDTNQIIIPKYILGTEGNIQLRFDFDFNKFYNSTYGFYNISDIIINGESLDFQDIQKYFKFLEGSVIVEISNEYLNTLGLGTHEFELDLASGELFKGTFVVTDIESVNQTTNNSETTQNKVINNPKTGDNIIIYILTVITSIGLIIILNKTKKVNN